MARRVAFQARPYSNFRAMPRTSARRAHVKTARPFSSSASPPALPQPSFALPKFGLGFILGWAGAIAQREYFTGGQPESGQVRPPASASPPTRQGKVLQVIRRQDMATMPWKNGGGITHEVYRLNSTDPSHDFDVRLSIAEVRANGPFSKFPGVDRCIVLLEGDGFELQRKDGLQARFRRPGDLFGFAGEDDFHCKLPDGSSGVMDFNVMTHRASRRASVRRHESGGVVVAGRDGGSKGFVLALQAGSVGGVAMSQGEVAVVAGEVLATMAVVSVDVSIL